MGRLHCLIALLLITVLTACSKQLPFPTPGGQDLIVVTRPGPLIHNVDEAGAIGGLEYDLSALLAEELGVVVHHEVLSPGDLGDRLNEGNYHLGLAWLSPAADPSIEASLPLFSTHDVLAQHEASLPLRSLEQLSGKTVHVIAGSRQAATMARLAQEIDELTVVEVTEGDILDLVEALGEQKIRYIAMDARLEDVANQYVPALRASLKLSEAAPIVWWLGRTPNPEFRERVNGFIERVKSDGTLARLEERYFGHVRRLKQVDIEKFLGHIRTTLPGLRKHFHDAERLTGIDWRLIAAMAWQESHWDPFATSYTNVRGMMMLTEETADRLGVSNRLDARESILGGARYLNILRNGLGDVPEPDRTWLAIAGYNIGPGHLNAARTIARQLKADADAWYDMKRILPLLAQPRYYSRLKSGRARGGEAVIMTENIRSYYDILSRNEAPLAPGEASISGTDSQAAPRLRR